MSEQREFNLKPACLSLRHKLMYVDMRQSTPGLVDQDSDTRVYFCIATQDTLGPDNEPVCPKSCSPERSCYKH
ncbi:MAG: hypothetical protein JNK35_08575 [Phycisphaerae bacterium]|nr:hypothetical protein [Phycisphaerae bacterium]